jgi:hypothetical protein
MGQFYCFLCAFCKIEIVYFHLIINGRKKMKSAGIFVFMEAFEGDLQYNTNKDSNPRAFPTARPV